MTDIADRASVAEQQQLEDALSKARGLWPVVATPPPDKRCRDCDDFIGEARLAAVPHAQRCIGCERIWSGKCMQYAAR